MTNEVIVNLDKKQKRSSKIKGFIRKRKKLSIFLVILLILIGVVVFLSIRSGAGTGLMAATDPVMREDIEYHVKVSGITSAKSEQHILAKSSGTIGKILVSAGERITAGQSLAVIESAELEAQIAEAKVRVDMETTRLQQSKQGLSSAKSDLTALESSYNIAKQTYEANQALYREGALSKIELDTSKLELERAQTAYEEAKKAVSGGNHTQNINLQSDSLTLAKIEYAALLEQKSNLTVKASIDGAVGEILIKAGQSVVTGAELFYVVDNDQIEITANVGEYDAQNIGIGLPVTITSDGSDGQTYHTTVAYISPYAKKVDIGQSTQTVVEVKAVLSGADLGLKAGYSVNVDILCDSRENVLTIPYESILTDKNGTKYVFQYDAEGNPVSYPIQTGLEGSLRVELTAGDIKEGDELILNPTEDMLKAAGESADKGKDEK